MIARHLGAIVFFGLAAAAPLVTGDAYFLDMIILILLWGAISAAWNVAGGYAGQVSLGHAAFFGIGAYSAAVLAVHWGLSPWIGLVLGMALSIVAGLVIGFLSNRLRGPYFVLATIAFAQVLLITASRWREMTMGSEGIPVPFRPGLWTLGLQSKVSWLFLTLAFALVLYLVQVYLEVSRMGFQLAGVREDEDAAQALGIASRRLKVVTIAISAALTSAGGTFWAQYVGFVDPFYVFSIDLSVLFALNTIIGGVGLALGPFLGSILITSLDHYLRATLSGIAPGLIGIHLIVYGCVLVIMVRFVPQGLVGALGSLIGRRVRRDARERLART
ncbi:MAG: branched-chain amino acid ABC transporter permease [Candidatus Rokuibacteriota bacterium]